MTAPIGTLAVLLDHVVRAVSRLAQCISTPPGVITLMAELGINVTDAPTSMRNLAAPIEQLLTAYTSFRTAVEAGGEESAEAVSRALTLGSTSQEVFTAIAALPSSLRADLARFPELRSTVDLDVFGQRLLDYIVIRYFENEHPAVYNALLLAGLIEVTYHDGDDQFIPPYVRRVVRYDHFKQLPEDPAAVATAVYGWGTSHFDDNTFLRRAFYLCASLGVNCSMYQSNATVDAAAGAGLEAGEGPSQELRLRLYSAATETENGEFGIGMSGLPATPAGNDVGLLVRPYVLGSAQTSFALSDMVSLAIASEFNATAGVAARLRPPPTGVSIVLGFIGANAPGSGSGLTMTLAFAPPGTRLLIGGQPGIVTVDAAGLELLCALRIEGDGNPSVAIELGLRDGKVAIDGSKRDGFLQRILPAGTIEAPFDVAAVWSNRSGFSFRGAAGLDVTLPVNASVFGVLEIESVQLALKLEAAEATAGSGSTGSAGATLVVSTTVSVQLGPIKAAVERFGLRGLLTFPSGGGNLGIADLAVTFQPPNGVGLEIDAGVVTGGGYLLFDPAREQYAGAIQLEVAEKLSLTAFGLLTTRMPDGSPGYSLLILMATEFDPPVQLGYGFTLGGVGGLIGVNRTTAVDALRAGLRAGTLGALMFPKDPIRNAAQIVNDLGTVFPPADGRYIFGPMALLRWGTPTLLTLELAVLLELPEPIRLIILGRLRVVLPDEQHAIVRLQLDALGTYDFAKGDIALDAVLYDSEVAGFAVTGEMALRANFGTTPNFALAIGGFYPGYVAPSGFPALERVAIALATGNNPRIRLAAYLAVTTNTVQFGARVDLHAKAGKQFSIDASLAFDTLIRFNPFALAADLEGSAALKCDSKTLMSILVQLSLTGPTPWHAWGRARFQVLFIKGTVHFDVTIGDALPPPPPAPVKLRPLLEAALMQPENWGAQLPPGEHAIVTLCNRREMSGEHILVHPLSELQVSQHVVPLGVAITRFGNTTPDGECQFDLEVVGVDLEPIMDLFAPAQFHDMDDHEKLTAPAFAEERSGIRFSVREFRTCTFDNGNIVVEPDMQYETPRPWGSPTKTDRSGIGGQAVRAASPSPRPYVLTNAFLDRVSAGGAAGRAPLRTTGTAKYRAPRGSGGTARPSGRKGPTYIVTAGPLPARSPVTEYESYMGALAALRKAVKERPWERGRLRVMPASLGAEQ